MAAHVTAFHDDALAATKAVPRQVPKARTAGESLDAYQKRATGAALAAAQPIRDLVQRERQWLASVDGAQCPLVGAYGAALSAYWTVAGAIWTAHYAPDPALLGQALSSLDDLNTSVATAAAQLPNAARACEAAFEIGLGPPFGRVVGTQSIDILRDPARLHESPLGNLVADALRLAYPDAEAALVNSGGLRTDLVVSPPSAGERPGEITVGEMLMVVPFGDRTAIVTLTAKQLEAALVNGFTPACDPGFSGGTFRFPQLSGLTVTFHCDGATPVVDGMGKAPVGAGGSGVPIRPGDTIRVATLDYLLAGGDGYSMLAAGTGVERGDPLLDVAINYVAAHSSVAPAVEGRIVGP